MKAAAGVIVNVDVQPTQPYVPFDVVNNLNELVEKNALSLLSEDPNFIEAELITRMVKIGKSPKVTFESSLCLKKARAR